jgi:asparagine synthase (glutamine-hydrolysing)
MCGIVAFVAVDAPVDEAALAAATATLEHRGPDGSTTWRSRDGRVGLGHTRLQIVGRHGGQPLRSEDGAVLAVVNGELYGWREARRRLERLGHAFATDTDSEIVVHLYEEYGAALVDHLRGEFAFLLWDARRRCLLGARDRFGIKPLYYAPTRAGFVLASEPKALFAAGVKAEWDVRAALAAMHGCFAPSSSLFRGVTQVPPGHLIRVLNRVAVQRYWHPAFPRRGALAHPPRMEVAVAQVHNLLVDAIAARMHADVPVGYLLSGGLDSSAMLGVAATRAAAPPRAYSIAFDGSRHDESPAAAAAAAHVGAELRVVRATDALIAEHFISAVTQSEGLHVNAHGTARFLLSAAIQGDGIRCVMGGEGADELFAGYGFLARSVVGDGQARLKHAGRLVGRLSPDERVIAATSPILARALHGARLPDWTVARAGNWLSALRSVVASDTDGHRRDPYLRLARELHVPRGMLGREPARQLLLVWLRTVFAGYHLAADRLDMAHAVEVRLPYLDGPLFDYVGRLPVRLLTADGLQKGLLRRAVRPYVPESVLKAVKRPFIAPPSAAQPGTVLHDLVQDLLRSDAAADVPFLDQRGVIHLLDRLPRLDPPGRADLDPILMMAASAVALQSHLRPAR